jgi:hypothetical protein
MKRDKEHVLREYDREKWSMVLSTLKDIEPHNGMVYEILAKTYGGTPEERKKVNEAWGQINNILLLKSKGATAVAELGAGWGGQLLNLWIKGGPDVLHYAFEFTGKGRECVESLCDLVPDFTCVPLHFDFYDKETWEEATDLLRRELSPFIFTCHAIEQIPEISKEFFYKFIDDVPHAKYVHLEPVGWQLSNEKNEYVEKNDYNRNMMDVLLELEDEGAIKIDTMIGSVLCYKPENRTSYIEWTPR